MVVTPILRVPRSHRTAMSLARGLSLDPLRPHSVLTVACDNTAIARRSSEAAYSKVQVQPRRHRGRTMRLRRATVSLVRKICRVTRAAAPSAAVRASQSHSRIVHCLRRSVRQCASAGMVDSVWRVRLRRARVMSYSTRMAGNSPHRWSPVLCRRYRQATIQFLGIPSDNGALFFSFLARVGFLVTEGGW